MGQNGRKDDGDTRRKRTPSLSIYESIVQRSAPRAKAVKYCRSTIVTTRNTITTVLRTITSVNQLSLHGTVAEMCDEYESFHDRTERPVVGGQSDPSFVPSVIKTEVPLNSDDLARKDLLLQQYGERIEKLSQQDRLSKFCMDARIPECC